MGILDFFKKKEQTPINSSSFDDLDSGLNLDDLNSDIPSDSITPSNEFNPKLDFDEPKRTNNFNSNPFNQTQSHQSQNQTQNIHREDKTDELILAKLDSIRSDLTNVHHRLDKIEERLKRHW